MTSTVLEASWVEFLQNLKNANTLDDLYRMHVVYIKMVLFRWVSFVYEWYRWAVPIFTLVLQ